MIMRFFCLFAHGLPDHDFPAHEFPNHVFLLMDFLIMDFLFLDHGSHTLSGNLFLARFLIMISLTPKKKC
jgi:hypothetical protein